jgi:hypothetical protein
MLEVKNNAVPRIYFAVKDAALVAVAPDGKVPGEDVALWTDGTIEGDWAGSMITTRVEVAVRPVRSVTT